MTDTRTSRTINLTVTDASRQRRFATRVDVDQPVSVALSKILAEMDLPPNEQSQEAAWTARLDREARQLHGNEIVGQALVEDDTIVLQPEVNAG